MGIFKKPRFGFPWTSMDVKNLNDLVNAIFYKLTGNIEFLDLDSKFQESYNKVEANSSVVDSWKDTITADKINVNKLAAGTIDANEIHVVNLDATNITSGYISATVLDATNIKTAILNSGIITADSGIIATSAITTAQIANGSITDAKIVELTANKINAGTLSVERLEIRGSTSSIVYALNNISGALQAQNVNTLNGETLTPRTITADKIVAQAITANEIAANTITANKLVAGTITAASGVIASIDAGTITVGTMVGERISGGTITGTLIKTSNTANYMTLQNQYLSMWTSSQEKLRVGYDGAGNPAVRFWDSDGVEISLFALSNSLRTGNFHSTGVYVGQTVVGNNNLRFNSTIDGTDYGYIIYSSDDNTYAFWGDSSENGLLRIGIQDNGSGIASDVFALESPAAVILATPETRALGHVRIMAGASTALIIDNGGDILVTAQVSGSDTNIYNDSGQLNFSTAIGSPAFNNTSDRNLKTDIQSFDNSYAYNLVKNLKLYKYKYDSTKFKTSRGINVDPDQEHLGIMADEAPTELLAEDGKGVNLYSMLSATTATVQELIKIVEEIKNGQRV